MFRRVHLHLLVPVVVVGALALTALPAEAQRRGGRAGGRGFAGRPRGAVAFGPRGGVAFGPRGGVAIGPRGGIGIGPRGRVFVGPGVGARGFRPIGGRGFGFGLGFGGGGFGGGGFGGSGGLGGYGGYGGGGSGGYLPYMPDYSGYAMPGAYENAVPPSGEPRLMGPADSSPDSSSGNGNTAHLLIAVPEDATVWFEGEKMSQAGSEREFVSPPLTPRKRFVYTIRVRYTNDKDEAVDETRKIYVRAGDRWRVDFTKPARRSPTRFPCRAPRIELVRPSSRVSAADR